MTVLSSGKWLGHRLSAPPECGEMKWPPRMKPRGTIEVGGVPVPNGDGGISKTRSAGFLSRNGTPAVSRQRRKMEDHSLYSLSFKYTYMYKLHYVHRWHSEFYIPNPKTHVY